MKIEPFKMERMQSTWEFKVLYNLAESGVHPLPLRELVSADEFEEMLNSELGYTQTNGTHDLRDTISRLYPGSSPDQVLVTTGSSEANFLLIWSLVEKNDDALFIMPNYMQMWGLLRGFGARVKKVYLRENLNWQPDLDELKRLFSPKTKMIILTNPNNPTGAQLNKEALETIVELASGAGAWIIADEVYQGAELNGLTTPSFFGKYEKTVVINGLSKAYGLPGLRMGWMVAPEDFIIKTWAYHDYTTICISTLTEKLALRALSSPKREKILLRTRRILNSNLALLKSWLGEQGEIFSFIPPQAGAICYVRYNLKINSTQLVEKLIREKSVLLVPGDHFEMDSYLRLGYGSKKEKLSAALGLLGETLHSLKASPA
ncbi:MAG: aminotransferase class I/II-fold pyridoxal phosphate-dependent enzyme [Candidatus Aminicenantales bacterium]